MFPDNGERGDGVDDDEGVVGVFFKCGIELSVEVDGVDVEM
jgi:hypothetical protein